MTVKTKSTKKKLRNAAAQEEKKAESMPKMADKSEIPAQKTAQDRSRPKRFGKKFRAQVSRPKSGTFVPEKVLNFSNHFKPFQTISNKIDFVASIFSSTPTFLPGLVRVLSNQ